MLRLIYVSCLSLLCCVVHYLQPCDHLVGNGCRVCDVSCVFVTFPYGAPGHVCYLIVSIPDLCLLLYLYEKFEKGDL